MPTIEVTDEDLTTLRALVGDYTRQLHRQIDRSDVVAHGRTTTRQEFERASNLGAKLAGRPPLFETESAPLDAYARAVTGLDERACSRFNEALRGLQS